LNAKASALKAVELNKSLAEAHTCLGVLSFRYEWNWSNAEVEFRSALATKPNDPLALFEHAKSLAAVGRLDEALQEARRAQRYDPASLKINDELGRVYYWNRNYNEAISTFRHVLELDPNYGRAHARLGKAYLAQGKFPEAVLELQEARRLDASSNPNIEGLLGYAEALNGDTKQSLRALENLRERSRREHIPAFSMVLISLGVGDRRQALTLLMKAYEDHSEHLSYAKIDPLFDPFRSDPQFVDLLSRMGLSQSTSAVNLNLSRGRPVDFRTGI
jgi:tetratricopeptide (TPR) repeat protein